MKQLALFTIITTLLAIPLIFLVAQEKQTIRQFIAENQTESVKGTMTGAVSGYVFIDSNTNGQRDSGEKPYPNAVLRIFTKVNNVISTRDTITDSYGYFFFRLDNQPTGVQIKLIVTDGYKATTPNPVTVVNSPKQIVEFGVYSSAVVPSKAIKVRPTEYYRPAAKVVPTEKL